LRRRLTLIAIIGLLATSGSGCGYALAGRGTFLPADIKIVGIPPIENKLKNI